MAERWRSPQNPFNITKAVDFSDQEIVSTWVDLPSPGGFQAFIDPRSVMPIFLLGGKGSGRTHLMRYYSSAGQAVRASGRLLQAIETDGYVGVYLRCSGLNSGRFTGKGVEETAWHAVFTYYFDLWLLQLTLDTVRSLLGEAGTSTGEEIRFVGEVLSLFDDHIIVRREHTLAMLLESLHELQRKVDVAVNNAALTRQLDVRVRATRGRVIFGVGKILREALPTLSHVQLLYLIDELENLNNDQQRYINTLVREKENPVSFIVGSRLFGFRTRETYSASEMNKEGSEYQAVYLDRHHLDDERTYDKFCRRLVARRLLESDVVNEGDLVLARSVDRFFATTPSDRLGDADVGYVLDGPWQNDRPWIRRVRDSLARFARREVTPGITSHEDIERVIEAISNPMHPLIEKTNAYLLFKAWSRRQQSLIEAASAVGASAARYVAGDRAPLHESALKLFRTDLIAQILRETNRRQRYLGVETFIHMSGGMPRNLVITLKHIYRWASFFDENPFANGPISEEAQREGVAAASAWFFEDAPGIGELGRDVQDAIGRLGSFFRVLRYADKPVESSLVTFSVALGPVSARARSVIEAAEKWSLILPVSRGERQRNTGAVDSKFQLNPMLAPRFDLPIYRRGTIALTAMEADAIFDPEQAKAYAAVVRRREARMTAPFTGALPEAEHRLRQEALL